MESDWTVACAADDPWIVVPWHGSDQTDRSLRFIDLRGQPESTAEIPEARRYPALAEALVRWNQMAGPLFTVKCDVWTYPARLFDGVDLPGFSFAHAGYVDLIPAGEIVFAEFPASEALLRNCALLAGRTSGTAARSEWVLRPARILESEMQCARDGFGITMYVWGYGESEAEAADAWSAALTGLIDPVVLTFGAAHAGSGP